MEIRHLFLLTVAFATLACSKKAQKQAQSTETPRAEAVEHHLIDSIEVNGTWVYIDSVVRSEVHFFALIADSIFNPVIGLEENAEITLQPVLDKIKWSSKGYEDLKLSYRTFAEHQYGTNIGGWEREFHFIELHDGKTGDKYFTAEHFSHSSEEHSISKDTSHPLASTSCFFQYQIEFKPERDFLKIHSLDGSCLPDLEEGIYKFANNKLVLTRD